MEGRRIGRRRRGQKVRREKARVGRRKGRMVWIGQVLRAPWQMWIQRRRKITLEQLSFLTPKPWEMPVSPGAGQVHTAVIDMLALFTKTPNIRANLSNF
jgi:hypothetical protein